MTFVYPAFLWALFAVSVPVIIHLFNFRRYKKIYFSNVRFLKELQNESKSKSRLKELLVLAARCLAIACLVLAFAQPVMRSGESRPVAGQQAISIYIDNSFSMENVQKQGPLIAIAKTKAAEIVNAFSSADRFHLLTNDFEGRHQRFLSKEDMLSAIEDVKVSPSVRLLSDVLKRQNEFLRNGGGKTKRAFVISDAQRSTFNINDIKPDTTAFLSILPLKAARVNNVFLDTCWFESPLQQKGFIQKLHAVVQNSGDQQIEAGSAKLYLNGRQQAISSFSLQAGDSQELVFSFECRESGFNFGSIRIEDYPISFDDELFFAFNSKLSISVTLINGNEFPNANYFEALLKNDSLFSLTVQPERAIDYSAFRNSDMIILNELKEISSGLAEELRKFASRGGSVLLVPSAEPNLQGYNDLLVSMGMPLFSGKDTSRSTLDQIEKGNPFYSGVFEKLDERMNLPSVNLHFLTSAGNRSAHQPVLRLQNGDPFLSFVSYRGGNVYVSSAPFSPRSGNFARHALFVPTVYRIAFNSLRPAALFYTVNSDAVLQLKSEADFNDRPYRLRELENKAEIIPEMRSVNNTVSLFLRGQVNIPGFYELGREDRKLLPLAFNYSRRESDLSAYPPDELSSVIADRFTAKTKLLDASTDNLSRDVLEESQGRKLWKLFIILALSFLLVEILLLRFLK